ncbi:MAG TPA: molecular chaperone DnaJ [Propioniciclava sp.]|uniref:molecular chaperone DnaJ n=1 Tax=Propioniciclava sp. TaxID=2038686 RepID=UPI002CB37BD3|nr:molecular chaperone DnaJ [Propioniciclava sp.]HRL49605.1 molecular chaperone DnaJ [Propioniciclava sp.]HRL81272.1 molecular chaperone DnaJ [Propioniciclava sp.]
MSTNAEKDYYKALGVSKDAKPDEIKKAFRKLARDNHPDQHPGDAAAEKRFKEVSEAYSVLSDTKKRKEYDDQRSMMGGFRFPGGGGSTSGGASGPSVEDLFRNAGDQNISDLFGGLFRNSGGSRRTTRTTARRGSDIEGEVSIEFDQAVNGTTVSMQTISDTPCTACRGTGAAPGTAPEICPTCEGSGSTMTQTSGGFTVSEPCPTCHGRGLYVADPCPVCHGSGRGRSSKTMQVRIPAGVEDGQRLRLKGKGGAGENGGAAGDLFVLVNVKAHALFGRKGDNLTVTVPVTYSEAALGADIEVPTLGGQRVKLRIPAGTPNGRTFRVRGRGVPKKNGEKADLLVSVEVQVPSAMNAAATEALKAHAAALGSTDPRAGLFAK